MLTFNVISNASSAVKFSLSRGLWSSCSRMQEAFDNIEKNPYFKKYEQKIVKFQKSSPSEFINRAVKAVEKKKEEPGGHGFSKPAEKGKKSLPKAAYAFAPQKKLDSVMKVDMLQSKSSKDIEFIWTQYFLNQDTVCGSMTTEKFEKILDRATSYPIFLFPLPRDQGYEFIVAQFAANEIHFTPLINYQTYQENAPECFSIVHYPDLSKEKGIVLFNGNYNKDIMNAHEAQFLANQIQLYYGGDDQEKLELLDRFRNSPDTFKHSDLILQIEKLDLSLLAMAK